MSPTVSRWRQYSALHMTLGVTLSRHSSPATSTPGCSSRTSSLSRTRRPHSTWLQAERPASERFSCAHDTNRRRRARHRQRRRRPHNGRWWPQPARLQSSRHPQFAERPSLLDEEDRQVLVMGPFAPRAHLRLSHGHQLSPASDETASIGIEIRITSYSRGAARRPAPFPVPADSLRGRGKHPPKRGLDVCPRRLSVGTMKNDR